MKFCDFLKRMNKIFHVYFLWKFNKTLLFNNDHKIFLNSNLLSCVLVHNLINFEILLHCVEICLLNFWILCAVANCREKNIQWYTCFGLCSKYVSCFNCSNLKRNDLTQNV